MGLLYPSEDARSLYRGIHDASPKVRDSGGEHGDEVVGPEQTIGLLSLLARDDDGLDAVAEADTVTLALRADDVFEDDFGILYGQLRDLAEQLLKLRRWIPEGTYLAPGQNAGEPPTGHIDLVQQLLFLRDGALGNANMDALLATAQRMRTARFEPGATLWRAGGTIRVHVCPAVRPGPVHDKRRQALRLRAGLPPREPGVTV